ncbi:hypothetical protein [Marinobacterium arenosum]|uniref:hypothetical protein n=1 Tax=Marinobacterium arenosum TaxID=2862496 RepID=UPI001C953B1F|nr:hypothetical protein [Marinobacterium arenosum]MBY4679113.1 hypothetical protein [Marinobacterium arenosum]
MIYKGCAVIATMALCVLAFSQVYEYQAKPINGIAYTIKANKLTGKRCFEYDTFNELEYSALAVKTIAPSCGDKETVDKTV